MRETMLIHAMDSMPIEHIVHVRCCLILCSLSVMPALHARGTHAQTQKRHYGRTFGGGDNFIVAPAATNSNRAAFKTALDKKSVPLARKSKRDALMNFLLMDIPASPGNVAMQDYLLTAPENDAECGSDAASNMRPAAR
jgi:hypothetical protein